MENDLIQSSSVIIGLLAIITLVIRELFAYLKSRKEGNSADTLSGQGNQLNSLILAELTKMNNNHLHTIQEVLESGNARLIDAIHNDNTKMIELLGEIKGNLNTRR